ncbi:MAG: HupE/UreJ family protein [Deltaproteobacteria bacterium]|nr:HupE/UreJ family protein [Deltaproteobacteria bacterium]
MSTRLTTWRRLGAVAAWLLLALPAAAHPLAPSLLRLDADGGGAVQLTWRTPAARVAGSALAPELPADCQPLGPATEALVDGGAAIERRATLHCGAAGLVGQRVAVSGLDASATDVLLSITLRDGREIQSLLHAGDPSFVVPSRQGALEVVGAYLRLGVEHLLTGLDHLAFLLGLLLLVPRRRLLAAVTAFTLGHSLTLALATLGLVRVWPPLVELGIAASIVALALDAVRATTSARPPWLARHPGALCAAFGLLHGLGFAGALAETGLPDHAIPLALLAFNCGIELGQLAVLGLALGAASLVSLAASRAALPQAALRLLSATVVGAAGAFWLLERALLLS